MVEVADLVKATDLVEEKKSVNLVEVTSGRGKNQSEQGSYKSKVLYQSKVYISPRFRKEILS